MAPFIALLVKSGLSLVANAALAKGKEYVEQQTGVKLDDSLTPESLTKLRQFELENEPDLMRLRVEDNRIDAELEKARLADVDSARRSYATEWQYADHTSWFGQAVDGISRLVRPLVTYGLIGMLFGLVPVPTSLPGEYWSVLMLVLGFWFGGRLLKKDGGIDAIKAVRR